MSYLAVDVGGTKTLVVAFSATGEVKDSHKFETPVLYEDFLDELAKNVDKLSTKVFSGGVVAIPGKVDRHRGVGVAFGNLAWQNVSIQSDISRLADCPIRIENDANLAGLSEARALEGIYKKVLYITISTGINGAMVINGTLDGHTRDSELGHMLLEHDGQLMQWEEFASGKAIVAKFGKKARDIPDGDTRTWYIIARNIAIGLIDLVAVYTPDVIVIGGGVGTHLGKFKNRLIEELKIYENPLLTIPVIQKAKRPEKAVIYGCYEYAKDYYGKSS